MCGRYTLTTSVARLVDLFALANRPNLPPRYNIAPTQDVAAVRVEDGKRTLGLLRWGLVPPWAKDAKIGAPLINARAETLAEKPAFRAAFKRRRCLIVADGFYEWTASEGGGRQPYRITMKDEAPFAFAGLWEAWQPKGAEKVLSCAIVTCEANELLRPLHDRMPAILPHSAIASWLDEETEAEKLAAMLRPYPSEAMAFRAVSTRVNSVRNDDADCIAPLESTRLL